MQNMEMFAMIQVQTLVQDSLFHRHTKSQHISTCEHQHVIIVGWDQVANGIVYLTRDQTYF